MGLILEDCLCIFGKFNNVHVNQWSEDWEYRFRVDKKHDEGIFSKASDQIDWVGWGFFQIIEGRMLC